MNKLKAYFNKERLIIFMSVLLFYGNILKNDYSLDDSIVTEKDNITSKGFRAIPKLLKSYVLLFWKNIYQNLGRNKKI